MTIFSFSTYLMPREESLVARKYISQEINNNFDHDGVETVETKINKIDGRPGEGTAWRCLT